MGLSPRNILAPPFTARTLTFSAIPAIPLADMAIPRPLLHPLVNTRTPSEQLGLSSRRDTDVLGVCGLVRSCCGNDQTAALLVWV